MFLRASKLHVSYKLTETCPTCDNNNSIESLSILDSTIWEIRRSE